VEGIAAVGDAEALVGVVVAGLIEDGVEADVGPDLVGLVEAGRIADEIEVVGGPEGGHAADGEEVAGGGGADDGLQVFLGPLAALEPVLLVGEELRAPC